MSFMTNDAAIAGLNAITALLGADSLLRVYSGTVPTSADAGLGAAVQLAELAMDTPSAFGGATDGGGYAVATAGPIIADSDADEGGDPSFFRMVTSLGVTVLQGTAGGPSDGAEITFTSDTFQQGGRVEVDSYSQKLFEQ